MKKAERPINLSLLAFQFPVPAITSITHRITGVVLFVGIGFLLYVLELALSSPEGYAHAQELLAAPAGKLVAFVVLAMLIFHIVAGIRHLIMDFHIGDSLAGGRLGAQLVIALSIVLIVAAGAWLW
jgi:succinate dehydrogenase / fumarate reductase cytochrome b subunit